METQIKAIARRWYLELIIGVLFIAAGVWVFMTPVSSYVALSIFFAITFLVTGIMKTSIAFSSRKYVVGWGWSFAGGIINILIGVLLVSMPVFTITVLPIYIGFALMFHSSLAIGFSIELSRLRIPDWGWLLFFGILGIVLAFILLWNPLFAGLTVVVYTAMAFLSIGIFQIFLSFRLMKLNRDIKREKL
jgi:uncharacterized membrane protein HdeD (DUF308 family)